jgi:hypothetical protein
MKNSLASVFIERTTDWHAHVAADEWFFAKLRDELIGSLSSSDAFHAITDFAVLIIEQKEPELRYEAAVVLLSLARHSDTSEMPQQLREAWSNVAAAFAVGQHSLLQELKAWYRVSEP